MFTDIFGYSRMVGKDEKHALKLLDKHNNIITEAIDAHNGSVIKFIGDAIFAEFTNPDEASHCSVNIILQG
jgi:class 3 adenylate cyclase